MDLLTTFPLRWVFYYRFKGNLLTDGYFGRCRLVLEKVVLALELLVKNPRSTLWLKKFVHAYFSTYYVVIWGLNKNERFERR